MAKVLVLVEGQTEEAFIKRVLYDYFSQQGIYLVPKIIATKIVKSGTNHKGGITSYRNVKKDLLSLHKDTDADGITTMIDFYGLPPCFPRWDTSGNCYQQVADAERVFGEDINEERFIPYLQLHEFEGLLFSNPSVIASVFGGKLREMEQIRARFTTPEEINNSPQTAPSKRLLNAYPAYNKVVYGSIIAGRIGIDRVLVECPHFKEWSDKLLQLTPS